MLEKLKLDTGYICPVCGNTLDFKAWDHGSGSQEICPCCGTQFGYTDSGIGDIKLDWKKIREQWIANGMRWWHPESPFIENNPLKNWNPRQQLKNIPKEFLAEDEKY